jgi:hypothetical protein
VKISRQVSDYESYSWTKLQIEIPILRFFTRLDIPAKGHWVTVEEEQGSPF